MSIRIRDLDTDEIVEVSTDIARHLIQQRRAVLVAKPGDARVAQDEGAAPSLADLKVDELKSYAADRAIDLTGVTKKDDIIAAIEGAQDADSASDDA